MIVAIDPGIKTGHAIFDNGQLVHAGTGLPALFCDHVVIEKPVIYPKGTPNPNAIVKLALRVGEYSERARAGGCTVELVEPRTWKGGLDKDRHHVRILHALTKEEKGLVKDILARLPKGKHGDVLDAVGLGMWKVGRHV